MGFLSSLKERSLRGGLFWCHTGEGKHKDAIISLLQKQNGVSISIPGFDELMLVLSERLGFDLLTATEAISRARKRYEGYIRQVGVLLEAVYAQDDPRHQQAFMTLLDRIPRSERAQWWYWESRARSLGEEQREKSFRDGLKNHPHNALLHSHFACFLTDVRMNMKAAHIEHKKAYQLQPNAPTVVANYA